MRRAALLFVLLLAGCGGGVADREAERLATQPAAEEEREPAPPIAGPTLTGAEAALADLRGKPVFVNVWASW